MPSGILTKPDEAGHLGTLGLSRQGRSGIEFTSIARTIREVSFRSPQPEWASLP